MTLPRRPPIRLDVGYTAAAVGYVAGIFVLSGSPGELGPSSLLVVKLLHLPLFAGVAASLLLAVNRGRWTARVGWRTYAAIGVLAAAVAVLDEWLQTFTVDRQGSVGDVLLDWVGIVALLAAHRLTSAAPPPGPAAAREPVTPAVPQYERKPRPASPDRRASGAARH